MTSSSSQEKGNEPPFIGILIPTYKRPANLIKTLQHLEAQTWKSFEVVVVDDGSPDDTLARLEEYRTTAPFPITVASQANTGPAAARNHGIRLVRAPITLMIGDDTYPNADLVRLHAEDHLRHPQLEHGALGFTRYSEQDQVVTPFMRWLSLDGVQFAYRELLAGGTPDWRHFYTSNLSLKTAYLRANPFHEGFTRYGMEDIELGYRLHKEHGFEMSFLPSAIAEHVHPITFSQVCRRAVDTGTNTFYFAQLWPEHGRQLRPGSYKRSVMTALMGPMFWPGLAWFGDLITRRWCNPALVSRFIDFNNDRGYAAAVLAAKSQAR